MIKDQSYHYDIPDSANSNNNIFQDLEDTPLGQKVRQALMVGKDAMDNELHPEDNSTQNNNEKLLRMKHEQSILLNKAFALTSKNTILKNVNISKIIYIATKPNGHEIQ